MRPLTIVMPLLCAAATAGCVAPGAYPAGYQQPYAQPYATSAPDYTEDQPTFYDDRPAVLYGGQPAYIIEEPGLGWGWRGPDRRWHSAPPGWRGPGDWERNRRGPAAYRQEYRGYSRPEPPREGFRPQQYRQPEQRQPERPQFQRPPQRAPEAPRPQAQPQRAPEQRQPFQGRRNPDENRPQLEQGR